jgi:pheromone shutdown protein TraB
VFASTTEAPVLLVGTAHVVDLGAALRRTLEGRALQGIAVELDAERARALLGPPDAGARGGRTGAPLLLRLWAALQRRLGQEIGVGAGAEMRAAAALAQEWRIPLLLIDDPIRETLARLVRGLSVRERFSLIAASLVGIFLPTRIVEAQIGAYRKEPAPLLEQMRSEFPGVTRVLVDERNEHMAERLVQLRGRGFVRVAAVVGDAHVPGLAEALRRRTVPVEVVRFGQLEPTARSAGSARPG